MRPPPLVLAFTLLAACGRHTVERRGSSPGTGSPLPPAPSSNAARTSSTASASTHLTVVFEDEIERKPPSSGRAAVSGASPSVSADFGDILASLDHQLSSRGGIQWSVSRPLTWADFQAAPEAGGRTGAISSTGQIFGSACAGSRLRYGVIAAFIPGESWVRPAVAADPNMSARALAHEQTHFNISEIIARELRRNLATIAHPCDMTQGERDALGVASVNEERATQERYDRETNHGLDMAAQQGWQAWAAATLQALSEYASPVGARENQ